MCPRIRKSSAQCRNRMTLNGYPMSMDEYTARIVYLPTSVDSNAQEDTSECLQAYQARGNYDASAMVNVGT